MTTLIFRAGENPTQCSQIPLGIRAENEVTQVALDFSPWAEEFGAGVVQLLVRRDGDSSPYPVVLTQSGTTATWTVSSTDLAANGPLQAEFIYTVGTLVKKSEVLRFYVLRDIGAPGSAPDPYETWLETLIEIAAQTQQDAAAAAGDAADAEAAAQAIQDMGVQADTLEPGSYATVDKIVDPDTGAVTLVFGIPRGQDGSGGDELWEAGTGTDAIAAKTASNPDYSNTASGDFAVAAGFASVASGQSSFAIGNRTSGVSTTASGESSFAQGKGCTASGVASQAMGQKNEAIGNLSHAVGTYCKAKGTASAAFGGYSIASGRSSFVVGQYNVEDTNADINGTNSKKYGLILGNGTADDARSNAMTVDWNGNEVLAGKLTLGAGPTANMDAATKQYADERIFWATYGTTTYTEIVDALNANKEVLLRIAISADDYIVARIAEYDQPRERIRFTGRDRDRTIYSVTVDSTNNWSPETSSMVRSVNGKTGSVTLTAADVGAGTYSKPSGGIPSTDLSSDVQASLGKADTAYQKPSGGIPAEDLASGVIPTVPSAYASNPAALGTAAPGSSTSWAKGDHIHPKPTPADLGAIPAPSSPASGAFLVWDGSAWVAQTLTVWQASNY